MKIIIIAIVALIFIGCKNSESEKRKQNERYREELYRYRQAADLNSKIALVYAGVNRQDLADSSMKLAHRYLDSTNKYYALMYPKKKP